MVAVRMVCVCNMPVEEIVNILVRHFTWVRYRLSYYDEGGLEGPGPFLDTVLRTDRCVHVGHNLLAFWVVLGKVGKCLHDLHHQDLTYGSVSNP